MSETNMFGRTTINVSPLVTALPIGTQLELDGTVYMVTEYAAAGETTVAVVLKAQHGIEYGEFREFPD